MDNQQNEATKDFMQVYTTHTRIVFTFFENHETKIFMIQFSFMAANYLIRGLVSTSYKFQSWEDFMNMYKRQQ